MQINSFISSVVLIGTGVKLNYSATAMHDCCLGASTTVLPRVTIGSKCMIGAGGVATRDVPDGTTVVGVPAKSHI